MRAGIGLGAVCLLLLGCTQPARAPSPYAQPPIEPVRSEVGRYVIIHATTGERDKLLDTVTGRSWQLVESGGESAWRPIAGAP